jgi:ubiquinone/menaquinone biosynthesis C-methylase UbiE
MTNNKTDLASKKQVEAFYDTYTTKQKKIGVNIRHRTILKNLKALGLKSDSKVLEVGCGIGTVSGLIIKSIPNGSFTGVDISPESIEIAKKNNAGNKNVEFLVSDMSNFNHQTKFDFVVFPDVLEHIPVEQHANIFKTIAGITNPDVKILINIPEPYTLDWSRRNTPESLQIIDQSLSMQDLCNNSYPYGFYLYSVSPYGLRFEHEEYLSIVLKKHFTREKVVPKQKMTLAIENLKSKL